MLNSFVLVIVSKFWKITPTPSKNTVIWIVLQCVVWITFKPETGIATQIPLIRN
jgi:hypothetical protein